MPLSFLAFVADLRDHGAVARLYREELELLHDAFSCVAFAIFHAGYGPDNFPPLDAALRETGS